MDKKLKKAWIMLDHKKYHLCFEFNEKKETWQLFEKYDGWLKDDRKPIMTSEKYTNEDLLKFAKKHKEYDCCDYFKMLIIIPFIALILCIINLYLDNKYLLMFIDGLLTSSIIIDIINGIIMYKNNKILNYDWKRQRKRFLDSLEKFKEK